MNIFNLSFKRKEGEQLEEIKSMINESCEQGDLENEEAEMITNIFEFGEKDASDIMTPRNSIVTIDASNDFKEVLDFILNEKYSRYPVVSEDIDHIEGILFLKDAFRYFLSHPEVNCKIGEIKELLRPVSYVPQTKNIADLFKEMQKNKIHLSIILDEYGQTDGLVTMEDILEEIVGNILDEYDEDETPVEDAGNGEYLLDAGTALSDIEESLSIDFGDTIAKTLNGYIIAKMDCIPSDDCSYEFEDFGFKFKVLEAENKMIKKVLAVRVN